MRLCHGLAASSVPVSVKEVFNKETFFFTLLYFFEPTHNNTFIFQLIFYLLARSVREFVGPFWKTKKDKPSTNLYHNQFFSIKQSVEKYASYYNSREDLLFAVVLVRG